MRMENAVLLKFSLALMIVSLSLAAKADAGASCKVSKAQYDALKYEMAEADGMKILVCKGIVLNSSDANNSHLVTYGYSGVTKGKMMVTFKDGYLINKSEYQLE